MSPFVSVAWPDSGGTPGSIDIRTAADTDVGHSRYGIVEMWNDNPAFHTRSAATTSQVGVRFPNVLIPQGATITSATVTVYAPDNSRNYYSPADDTTVGLEQADNPVAPASGTKDSRSINTGTTTTWVQDGGFIYQNNDPMNAIDLTTGMQEVVNRAGWASGNAVVAWFLHGGNGTTANGFRPHQGQASGVTPRLQVEFTY